MKIPDKPVSNISTTRVYSFLIRALDERIKELEVARGYPRAVVDAMRELGVSDQEIKAFGLDAAYGTDGPHFIPRSPEQCARERVLPASEDTPPVDCVQITEDQALDCIRFFCGKANVRIGNEYEVWDRALVEDLFEEQRQAGVNSLPVEPIIIGGPRARQSCYAIGIFSPPYGSFLYFESNEWKVEWLYTQNGRLFLPSEKQTVAELREKYPAGTRLELVEMLDPYRTMPIGLRGTVRGVDDGANIQMTWDNGSSLNLVHGVDKWRILKPAAGKGLFDVYFLPNQAAVICVEMDNETEELLWNEAQEYLGEIDREDALGRLMAALECGELIVNRIERIE